MKTGRFGANHSQRKTAFNLADVLIEEGTKTGQKNQGKFTHQ